VGNLAPEFAVKPLAGPRAPLSLDKLRGSVVVLDFWGTYCGPCKQSLPKLQALSAKYSSDGLKVIGISEDEADDKGKIVPYVQARGATFAIAWDDDRSIARRYRPDTMPSTFVIDRRGVVRFVHVGYHEGDEKAVEREIRELLTQ
jgi:peroxiredoxin